MLCNKEKFQIELSPKIVLCQICISHRVLHRSASFPLLSSCRLIEFDSSVLNLPCVYVLLRLISIARYDLLNLPEFAFEEAIKFTVNMLLAFYISRTRLNKMT